MKAKNKVVTNKDEIQQRSAADLMPTDRISRKILLERAKQLAKRESEDNGKKESENYIRFRLGSNEYFGIPYQATQEVIDNITLTMLPCMPDYVAGVINRRGALLTIIDLKKFLHTQVSENEKTAYVIVVSAQGMSLGILADNIEGSDEYDKEVLSTTMPYEGVINPQFIVGLHQGVTAILNMEAITLELQQLLQKQ